jgi:hypothetical protein
VLKAGKAHATSERQSHNLDLALRLVRELRSGAEPAEIALIFKPDARCEVPGDVGVLPWIGHRTGRAAIADFIAGTREQTDAITFEIEDVLAGDRRAVIVGELASRIRTTGKVVETAFAIILSISDGLIDRFQFLEDSFAVSRAACS